MQFNTADYGLLRADAKRFAGRGDALNDAEPTRMTLSSRRTSRR
jgi:hypothetical protein